MCDSEQTLPIISLPPDSDSDFRSWWNISLRAKEATQTVLGRNWNFSFSFQNSGRCPFGQDNPWPPTWVTHLCEMAHFIIINHANVSESVPFKHMRTITSMHRICAFSSVCSSAHCVILSAQRKSSNAAIKAHWSGETLSGLNTHRPLWVPWTIPAVSTVSARDDRQMGHMALLCLREQEAHGYLTVASTLCIITSFFRLW